MSELIQGNEVSEELRAFMDLFYQIIDKPNPLSKDDVEAVTVDC